MPSSTPSGYKLERRWSLTHFLIGVFGAMAILGVMAKIFAFEAEVFGYLITWKPVVLVGFFGEALVFILMGMMREMQYVPVDEEDPDSARSDPVPSDSALNNVEEKLSHEADQLARDIETVREELSDQVTVLKDLRGLQDSLQTASQTLSNHSGTLESNLEDLQALQEEKASMSSDLTQIQQQLSEESEELIEEVVATREAIMALRNQFSQAAHRFQQFNAPSPTNGHAADELTKNASPTSA